MKQLSLLIFIVLLNTTTVLLAQDDDMPAPSSSPKADNWLLPESQPKPDMPFMAKVSKSRFSKLLILPDINFGIVDKQVNIGVSPYVGYKVWRGLYVGGGFTYIYSGTKDVVLDKIGGTPYSVSAYRQTFGLGTFLQYNIIKGFFVSARFEVLHKWIDDLNHAGVLRNPQTGAYYINLPKVGLTLPTLLMGTGYNFLAGKNLFLPLMVGYNILYPFTNKQFVVYPKGWLVKFGIVNIF
jgi:hypothetical protein